MAVIALLGLAVGCSNADEASGQAPAAQRPDRAVTLQHEGVTVMGEGRVTATPDTARVVIGVEVVRPDVATAFAEANSAAQAVLDALREKGVDDGDLRTRDISVRERRDRPRDAPPEVTGFAVRNLVELTVRDVTGSGDLIAAAVDAGGDAVRVRQFDLSLDEDAPALAEARKAAFADAERRAEQYAELAGRPLGELVALSENIGRPGGPVPVLEGGGAAAPPIEPGQEEITVRIQATWALD